MSRNIVMKAYNQLSDNEKLSLIKELYQKQNKSFHDIAESLGTYANKIRRDAIKFKIKIRSKSEAQANALKTGKHKHPTKGSIRSDSVKNKIGNSVLKSWEKLSKQEIQTRKNKAKDNWQKLSNDEKQFMQQKAHDAVRVSSKVGSKLEKFIFNRLITDGYKVIFHEERVLSNTKLQIDIMIPSMNVAIVIDGPSHFQPIWGSDALKRNIKYDQKKEGLLLGKGLILIRIQQTKDFSKSRALLVYSKLQDTLSKIHKQIISDKKILIDDI